MQKSRHKNSLLQKDLCLRSSGNNCFMTLLPGQTGKLVPGLTISQWLTGL